MERKPRFTAAELSVLVDEVERNRAILFSRLKNVTINADKKRAWEDITDKINSVGHGWRCTAVDVRGKWRDYASVTKRKAAGLRREQERTGGGSTSLPPLIPGEERVLAILGPEALEGVPGGIDVCGLRTSQTSMLSTPRSPPPGPATSDPLQCSPQAYSMPGPSTSAMPLPGPSTSAMPLPGASTSGPLRRGHHSLRAAVSPESPESSQPGSSPTPIHPAASPRHTRRCRNIRCRCSEELLRSESEEKIHSEGHQGGTGGPEGTEGETPSGGDGLPEGEIGLTGPTGQQTQRHTAPPNLRQH
nr:myb-related transcription factor, partner of profilin-like isoform X2 [Paramormyrops kingsleyae]